MKPVLYFHAGAGVLLAALIAFFHGPLASGSFLFGAAVSFFNLVVLVVVWPRILAKKLVALSVGIIVIKFAILGWILYEVVTQNVLQVGWFATGLGVIIITVLSASLLITQSAGSEGEVAAGTL